jgi:hypothetical protein
MRSEETFINSKKSNAKVKQGWFQKRGCHEEITFTIYKNKRGDSGDEPNRRLHQKQRTATESRRMRRIRRVSAGSGFMFMWTSHH